MEWGDYMHNDLTVTEIINVYHVKQSGWERNFFAARKFDAVVYFADGEIEYNFAHKTFTAKKGDLLFLPGNLPYSGKRHTRDVTIFVMDFKSLGEDDFEKIGAPCTVPIKDERNVYTSFSNAVDLWHKHTAESMLALKSILYSLISSIYTEEANIHSSHAINEVLSYVAKNIKNPNLSVKKICEEFYTSESQLRRNFRKITGLSPNEYIVTLRINKAKSELSYTGKSIADISYECGFSSPYYFSRCFSKYTGMTPSKYRSLTST